MCWICDIEIVNYMHLTLQFSYFVFMITHPLLLHLRPPHPEHVTGPLSSSHKTTALRFLSHDERKNISHRRTAVVNIACGKNTICYCTFITDALVVTISHLAFPEENFGR